MDWTDVGKKALGFGLPLLGTALGGPGGGAVGTLVASALGCDAEPQAVATAIDADTAQALVALRTVQENNRSELERLVITSETQIVLAVNQTMQVEAKSGGLSSIWRPVWGIISAAAFLLLVIGIIALGWKAIHSGNVTALNMIPLLVTACMGLFSIPGAILGVTAWHRGKMQRVQAGEGKETLAAATDAWAQIADKIKPQAD